jgi:hypothetical protein
VKSHFGSWNFDGLPNLQRAIARVKLIGLKNSLYFEKALGILMFEMGSHDPFGHLKRKLWPKEGPGIKLPI